MYFTLNIAEMWLSMINIYSNTYFVFNVIHRCEIDEVTQYTRYPIDKQ